MKTALVSIEEFVPRVVGPRDWGEELLLVQTDDYLLKRLTMKAGTAGGLQYHERKTESFHLHEGEALVSYDDGEGNLVHVTMHPGQTFHVPTFAPHRVKAITDCVFFEASVPVFDDRVRVEEEYGEPETGGLPTTGGR